MVDTLALGASGSNPMRVRVSLSAHKRIKIPNDLVRDFYNVPHCSCHLSRSGTLGHQHKEHMGRKKDEHDREYYSKREHDRSRNIGGNGSQILF